MTIPSLETAHAQEEQGILEELKKDPAAAPLVEIFQSPSLAGDSAIVDTQHYVARNIGIPGVNVFFSIKPSGYPTLSGYRLTLYNGAIEDVKMAVYWSKPRAEIASYTKDITGWPLPQPQFEIRLREQHFDDITYNTWFIQFLTEANAVLARNQ